VVYELIRSSEEAISVQPKAASTSSAEFILKFEVKMASSDDKNESVRRY
jgi:hypothetical protein